jgi:hypothetical protein
VPISSGSSRVGETAAPELATAPDQGNLSLLASPSQLRNPGQVRIPSPEPLT